MGKRDSQSKLYFDLQTSDMRRRKFKGNYKTFCARCNKDFEFKGSEVKDQVIKCPYCNYDNVFFYYDYKQEF